MSFTSVRTVRSLALVVLATATVASAQPTPGRPWVYDAAGTSKETTARRRATGAEVGTPIRDAQAVAILKMTARPVCQG